MKLDPKRKVAADFSSADANTRALVERNLDAVLRLGTLSGLKISSEHLNPDGAAVRSTAQFDLRISFNEGLDLKAEVTRLRKETERLARDIESKQSRLADQTFRSRAPEQIVRGLESTLASRRTEHQKLLERLAQLEKNLGKTDSGASAGV